MAKIVETLDLNKKERPMALKQCFNVWIDFETKKEIFEGRLQGNLL